MSVAPPNPSAEAQSKEDITDLYSVAEATPEDIERLSCGKDLVDCILQTGSSYVFHF